MVTLRLPLWVLLLRSTEVNGGFVVLLGLEDCRLGNAARYWLKPGIVDKTFEVGVGGEDYVDFLDVGGGEFIQRLCTLAAEGEPESSQAVELNLVAIQQLLTLATSHVGKHALDGTLREHGVVARHMGNELLGRHFFTNLTISISLSWLFWLHLVLQHTY